MGIDGRKVNGLTLPRAPSISASNQTNLISRFKDRTDKSIALCTIYTLHFLLHPSSFYPSHRRIEGSIIIGAIEVVCSAERLLRREIILKQTEEGDSSLLYYLHRPWE